MSNVEITGSRLRHGNKKRGMQTSEYCIWSHIKNRCLSESSPAYKYYGARGIKICDRWLDFVNFLNDMGPRPSKLHSIDRIDNEKGYCPENCRWATWKEQQRNRRSNKFVTFNGVTASLAEHCEALGLKYKTVHRRLVCGADLNAAFAAGRLKRNTIERLNK